MRLSRRALHAHALAVVATAASCPANAQSLDYGLKPQHLGGGIWLLRGLDEHLSVQNGGNIVNIAFLTTDDGIVLFDTGPSRAYGEQLKQAIALSSGQPLRQVIVSHAHPDHYLGNQAFKDVPIAALEGTISTIDQIGELFTDNMYRLVDYWMKGTVTTSPNLAIAGGPVRVGGRQLEIIALDGHTDADLAVFDHDSGTLIAGDLVFMNRAPTTPQANMQRWHNALDQLQKLPIRQIIPGHGPVTQGTVAIEQTRSYLTWLETKLKDAAEQGMAAAEVMALEADFAEADMAELDDEFIRSVSHLYNKIQFEALRPVN